ncbi:MAG: FMN-binding protein [Kineosporiaceae bacterium]|nr:FMN-binding protein [Kineosporiaceae bacterium]MBK8074792.1 FMN-binding protein [Kineosporiaceae bacterium]
MRKILAALAGTLGGLVLLFSYPTSTNSTASAAGTANTSDSGASAAAQTYTGDAVDTRWGVVQVAITVENGRITASDAVQYPQENHRDVEINDRALPILKQEVIDAQGADIDAVSGATVTSDGYVQSLQSALDAAHL